MAVAVAERRDEGEVRRGTLRGLYEAHKDEVFGFLLKLVRDRALAEDSLHEAFVRAFQGLDGFDASRPFGPWIARIARNVALDALRRRRKSAGTLEGRAEPVFEDRVAQDLDRTEALGDARAALAALPDETRALLIQRYGLGAKLEDLASSLECSDRTVRNRLRAAADTFARAFFERRSGGEGKP